MDDFNIVHTNIVHIRDNNRSNSNLVEEVCPICYKFLQSIYDKKKMKYVRKIVVNNEASDGAITASKSKNCLSLYHKKLTDNFKSSL